jgi:YVTN family beta-propeller protein
MRNGSLVFTMIVVIIFSWISPHLFKKVDAGSIPIPVGANPTGIAYNVENGNIYVANAGSHSLSVINGDTNSLIATILVGRIPYAVAYDFLNDQIYVANLGANDVSVINGATNGIITTIEVGKYPSSIIYHPINHNVYVANYNSSNISVINNSNQVVANISVGKNPIDLAYNSGNGGIYVANAGANSVSVINGATNSLIANISVGLYPTAVVYNPANNEIYVANKESGTVSVIDSVTNTVSKTIEVKSLPLGLAVNPNTNTIYLTHTRAKSMENKNPPSNITTVISGYDDKVITDVPLKSRPERATVSLKNNMIYVTNPDSNYVSVIDGRTNEPIETTSKLPLIAKFNADFLLGVVLIPFAFIVLLVPRRIRSYIRMTFVNLYYKTRSVHIYVTEFFNFVSRGWRLSSVALTIVSLIVLPVFVVLSEIHYEQMTLFFSKYSQYKEELEYERNISILLNIVIQGIFIAVLFLYPPYPAPYPSRKYFENRGFHTAVIEYEYVKKILYVTVPLFIVLTALTTIPFIQGQLELPVKSYLSISLKVVLQQPAFRVAQGIAFFIVFAGLLKLIFAVARKKFRLYYAKGCFEIINKWEYNKDKKDEVQKMGYVIKGLNSYNLYLHRHLNLHIPQMQSIYSKISRLPAKKKKGVIGALSNFFLQNNWETNTLGPVRYLYGFYISDERPAAKEEERPAAKEEERPAAKEEGFLIEQPFFDKVKNWSAFAAVIIPLVIAILDLYLKFPR